MNSQSTSKLRDLFFERENFISATFFPSIFLTMFDDWSAARELIFGGLGQMPSNFGERPLYSIRAKKCSHPIYHSLSLVKNSKTLYSKV